MNKETIPISEGDLMQANCVDDDLIIPTPSEFLDSRNDTVTRAKVGLSPLTLFSSSSGGGAGHVDLLPNHDSIPLRNKEVLVIIQSFV